MSLLGTLQVRLGLDSASLTDGMRAIPGQLQGISRQIEGAFSGIGSAFKVAAGLAAGFGAALTIKGVAEMVQHANDLTDSLNDSSTRLGIEIGQLQAFEASAKKAGIGVEQFEGLLKKFNKTTDEIKINESSQSVVDAFSRIGLSVQQVKASNPGDLFQKAIEGLGKIQDPAVRATTAMQLFGKQGSEALTLVADGAQGLAEERQLLADLGLALNEIDAAKVGEANDALDDLGTLIQAAKQKLGAGLAPAISSVTNMLIDAGKNGFDFGKAIADGLDWAMRAVDRFSSGVSIAWNSVAQIFHMLEGGIQQLASMVLSFGADVVDVIGTKFPQTFNGWITSLEEGLTWMKQGFHDFGVSIENAVISAMNSAGKKTAEFINETIEGINTLIQKSNELAGTDFSVVPKIDWKGFDPTPPSQVDPIKIDAWLPTFGQDTKDWLNEIADTYEKAGDETMDLARDNAEAVEKGWNEINSSDGGPIAKWWDQIKDKSHETAKKITEDYSGGNGVPAKVAGAVKEANQKIIEEFNILEHFGDAITKNIGSAIDEFVKTGTFNFKNFAKSILQDLAAITLKSTILGGILGNQKWGGDGSGIFGGGQMGNLFSGLLSGFSGAPKAIPLDKFGNPEWTYSNVPGGSNLFGGLGSLFSGLFKSFSSFEGGGYTWDGTRTGGVDGRGGRLSILHPRETVIDHEAVRRGANATRKASGKAINLSVPVTVNPGVSKEELAVTMQQVQTHIIQVIPALIQQGGRYASQFAA